MAFVQCPVLAQLGTILVIGSLAIVALVVLAVLGAGTSIGQYMLPRPVTDVVSKLMPWSRIGDATATASGDFQLQVRGIERLRTVHVRRLSDMTIAWTFDPAQQSPQSGTFCIHALSVHMDFPNENTSQRFQSQVLQSLNDVLTEKQFCEADSQTADIWVSVFGAMEDDLAVEELSKAVDRPQNPEWTAAVRKALAHDAGRNDTTLARGSIVLDVVDPQSATVLWHAAAIADVIVNVSESEKSRRTHEAIAEMLREFPPHHFPEA